MTIIKRYQENEILSVRCEINDSVFKKAIKSCNGQLENLSLPDTFLLNFFWMYLWNQVHYLHIPNSLEACHYIYDLCQLPRDQQWNKWQLNLDRSQVDIIPHKEDVEDFF